MKRDKIWGYVEITGEALVVVGAVAWLPVREAAPWLFALGVILFAAGRFLQTPFYQKYEERDPRELTLRRLYNQRVIGMVALVLSAMLMFMPVGFYYGLYLGATSWLVMFVVFVVVEVYTVFRISAVDKG
ncbi:MAG: hypothetical protein J1F40_07915 [Prevotellaceae bacterium]|nr:hypothetical protein [Prevotellaceae bacterium]